MKEFVSIVQVLDSSNSYSVKGDEESRCRELFLLWT